MRTAFVAALSFVLAACSASTEPPAQPKHESSVADRNADGVPDAAPVESTKSPQTQQEPPAVTATPKSAASPSVPAKNEVATFATGCYWCSEAIFQRIDGVVSVRSGFTGGTVPNPSYEQCCTGDTGHAESVEVTFDPSKVSYETLLDWFWRMHDPTTLNRQGADEGTQYRSAIFWHTDAQRAAAETSKKDAQSAFKDPIVTEITKAGPFYPAPAYHDDYYNKNSSQGYCRAVIAPKLHKLKLDEKR
jgi:peptide-methionine (S)-S-oxide reductase